MAKVLNVPRQWLELQIPNAREYMDDNKCLQDYEIPIGDLAVFCINTKKAKYLWNEGQVLGTPPTARFVHILKIPSQLSYLKRHAPLKLHISKKEFYVCVEMM